MVKRIGFVFVVIVSLICSHQLRAQSSEVELANSYFFKGDYEKAAIIYEKAFKKTKNFEDVYENYRKSLIALKKFDDLEKFIKKASKNNPEVVGYEIDLYLIDYAQNKPEIAEKGILSIYKKIKKNPLAINIAALHFQKRSQIDWAIHFYENSRKEIKDDYLYSNQLAELYAKKGKKKLLIEEYLKILAKENNRIDEIQNSLQTELNLEELDLLIDQLLGRITGPSKTENI